MLEYVELTNVGPAPHLRFDFHERLNVLTGDNGLGKSFLLDVAWWALTRTWAGTIALPNSKRKATIEYVVRGRAGAAQPVVSAFRRSEESWPVEAKRPPMPGIVVYVRVDGGFSVWDPARNYWRNDPGRPAAYHFSASQVWDGLDLDGRRVCEGLERDWVSWQEGQKPQFKALEAVLTALSPPAEQLRAGPPRRLFLGEGRDRPTLEVGGQQVPVALASAGIRRVLALAYFLVWAWHEHRMSAELLGRAPEDRFVILFDEPETHLHPKWQRQMVPSVLEALKVLRGEKAAAPQVLLATHSPLVLASLEPQFREDLDELLLLEVRNGKLELFSGVWAKQGDATGWLLSDVFGMEQARSLDAERAIEAAEALMRGEKSLPPGLDSQEAIHRELQRLLPPDDEFWPRWLVGPGDAMGLARRKRVPGRPRRRS